MQAGASALNSVQGIAGNCATRDNGQQGYRLPERNRRPAHIWDWPCQGWAAALLTLDTGADLSDAGDHTRLSTLGSAMLASLLRMPKAWLNLLHHTAVESP